MSLPVELDRTKRKIHPAGQATLEYVLLLFVTTTLIVGTIYQFNDAFRQFASNYFGSYLACLLEAGELPRLGDAEADSVCDTEYQPFNIASGRPPRKGGDGGRPSINETLKNNDRERSGRIDSETGQVAARGGDGGGGGGSVPTGRFDPKISSSREGAPDRVALTKAEKKEVDGVNKVENRTGPQAAGSSSRDVGVNGRVPLNQEESKGLGSTKNALLDETDPTGRRGARVPAQSAAQKKAIDDSEGDFTLSFWIRIIVIIMIVLAILFFIGGQVLQFVKSREKGDGN